eukprot:sb/3462755/
MVEQPCSENDEIKNAIRRLRKKLRQIRNLERLQRSLSPEERVKVGSRGELQESLGRFLSLAEQFNVSAVSDRSTTDQQQQNISVEQEREDGTGVSELVEDDRTGVNVSEIVEQEDGTQMAYDLLSEAASSPIPLDVSENSPSPTPTPLSKSLPAPAMISPTSKTPNKHTPAVSPTSKTPNKQTPVKTKPAAAKPVKFSAVWTELNTHQDDLVISTCVTPSYLCTGGRDRCVTLLSPSPPHHPLLHTLGEHTDTVTSILVLPDSSTILTTSLDCSVKVWKDGSLLHSTYLYSPITAAAIHGDRVVMGTQGGKVMSYNTARREVEWERVSHDDAVSAVEISDTLAFSASYNLVVWDLATQSKISEVEGARKVGSCAAVGNTLYFCNGGPSIKAWSEGRVRSVFRNSLAQHNSTDCIRVCGDLLLASVYELDSGSSVINVWNIKSSTYICTVAAPVSCITAIDVVSTSPSLYTALVSGTSTALLTLSKSDRLSGATFETGLRPYKKNECSELDSESKKIDRLLFFVSGRHKIQRIACELRGVDKMRSLERCLSLSACPELQKFKTIVDTPTLTSTIMRVKKIKPEQDAEFTARVGIIFNPICQINKLLVAAVNERREVYNTENEVHEALLMELWGTLQPDNPLENRISEQWDIIGFQGTDPATDFRGTKS